MVKVLIISADRRAFMEICSNVVSIATDRINSAVAINAKGNTILGMLYALLPVRVQRSSLGCVTKHRGHFTLELNLHLAVNVFLFNLLNLWTLK